MILPNTTNTAAPSRRITTRDLVFAGMIAAILTIISQISVPMPTGVPKTIQVFGITLIGVTFGWRLGLYGSLVYILLGAAGLPIFANFRGGFSVLVDFTGGYIWSWPIMAALCGLHIKSENKKLESASIFLFSFIGLVINETAGGMQWAALAGDMSAWGVFTYSMTAFVPKDIVLTILAVIFGIQLRKTLKRAGITR